MEGYITKQDFSIVLQVIRVISTIIDDTASDKTNEENHLQRRELHTVILETHVQTLPSYRIKLDSFTNSRHVISSWILKCRKYI